MSLVVLQSGRATALLSLYGAQVLNWQVGGQQQLWAQPQNMLDEAAAGGKAMRGGIPLCWPWFGPYANQFNLPEGTPAPQHGWARISTWKLESQGTNTVTCTLDAVAYGVPLTAEYTVTLRPEKLELTLTTTNIGEKALVVGAALHTYLATPDVTQARVHGLEGRCHAHLPSRQNRGEYAGPPVTPLGQDDYYGPAESAAVLHRPGLPPVRVEGGQGAVVWAPTPAQTHALGIAPDAAGNPPFTCLEAVLPLDGVMLDPGAVHTFSAVYALDTRGVAPL